MASALRPNAAYGDAASLLTALNELKSHINGTITLTASEIDANKLTVDANEASFASSSAIIAASLDLVRTYDAVLGPLWVTRTLPARASVTNDIHFTLYTVMQDIMDLTYKSATIANHESLLDGFKFESSSNFPGACSPPADPNAVLTATLSGSYANTFGRPTFGDGSGTYARKPTGCYLAPGSIATVTVPPALVGTGYRIRVGAHSWDFSNKPDFKRLDRVSLVYTITAATTKIASPLGGGIYIEVPFLANAGVVSVQIKNAVRSPYFSAKSFHTTTPVQWLAERENPAPWADFQTDKFMMQVPTSWISAMPDPTKLMQDWDAAMDTINDLMGFPRIRGKETVYPQVDLSIRTAAYSPGYPSVNNTYNPATDYGGYASSHLVRGPQIAPYWELHEQGHGYLFPKFPGEVESTVNLLHVPVLHQKFGNTLDQAFYKSSGGYTSVGTLDNTAVAWMGCLNFANGVAMAQLEKQYQLKGHAKFVDTARLFGWGKVNQYFTSFNNDFEANVTISETVDSLLLRLSKNIGTDMRPLFHFWGVPPINNTTLGTSIAAANLPASAAIYDTLVRYKSLVPANNAAFQVFTTNWWGRQPLLTGFTEENNHAQQWSTYDAATAAALQARVQSIINLYFPTGRPVDAIAPAIYTRSPADGAFGSSPTGNLVVTFTKPIVVGTGNVTIKNLTDGTQVAVGITSSQAAVAGAVLTINPTANLISGKTYAIQIDATAIDDTVGNSFAGIANDTMWTFTTSTPDMTAPTITDFSPADGVTNASKSGNLVLTFSEPIVVGTGNITLKNLTDATQSTIAITNSQVTVSGSVLTINPTAGLTPGKAYAIQIAATAIDDTAGNSFAGIINDTLWNFTAVTPDTTAPTITSLSPADNATGVANGSNLAITFSEAIKVGPGYITIKNLTDATQSVIAVADTNQVTVAGSVMTINPTLNFTVGKSYAIRIDSTAIDDLVGNSFAGIANDTSWNFTASALDTVNPTIAVLSPASNSTGVVDSISPVITFSKAVQVGTGFITLKNLTDVTQSVIAVTDTSQVTITGTAMTINPAINLVSDKTYAVCIDATAIDDLAGNGFDGINNDTTWVFTIATTVAPTVSIINPTSAAVTLADTAMMLRLEASVTAQSGTPSVVWSVVDGPGSVMFSAPAAVQTNASFSTVGTYTLLCTATNAGGSSSDRVRVGVGAPTLIELRQETGGYQHAATVIRGDQPTWNAGSRNQLLAGRNGSPFRSVFSFDLSLLSVGSVIQSATLDFKTVSGGSGTVGALQLRGLSATPVEGTGISDGTVGSNLGIGTGATWTTRTGGSLAGDLWSNAGGDFAPTVLSDTPGFLATEVTRTVTLPNTTALVAAVQTARNGSQPLNLILAATNELTSNAFVRLASDDDLLETNRPVLRLSFTGNLAPTVNPGLSPTAFIEIPVALGGSVTGSTSSEWRLISGPGNAVFSNPSSATSSVTFDQTGAYLLEFAATGAFGETSRILEVQVADPVPSVSIISPTSAAVTLADSSITLRLEASVTAEAGTPAIEWSVVDGPGTVTFSAPGEEQTNASFSAVGTYTLQCAATAETGGSTSIDRVRVGVGTPTIIELRQENGGYQHVATVIRGDQPTWNAGSRNQLLAGRNSNPFRSVFSFDLSALSLGSVIQTATLDLKTVSGGLGTVGALQLRSLSATPVEGTGISDGTAGADLGIGTGATWASRTGGSLAAELWSSAGGDFTATVLSNTPGFLSTEVNRAVTLPTTTALVAAVQTARNAGHPLNLILSATNELTSNAFVRLASDDDSLETNRPVLRLSFTGNLAPTVNPGQSPAAFTGLPAALGGSVTGSASSQWRFLSGPGTASFSNAASAASHVTFSQAGAYLLELAATGTFGETSRTLAIYVTAPDPATLAGWQVLTWPGVNDPNTIGPSIDPEYDGLNNLLEWALHLDATLPSVFRPTLAKAATEFQYTYTRRKTAPGAAVFQVEWSDTLGNDWSSVGVIEDPPVSLSASEESITVRIPEGSAGRRFLHLKVSIP